MLKSCMVCGRPSATNRCPKHAQAPRNGHTRQTRAHALAAVAGATACWYCHEGPRAGDPFEAAHVVAHALGGADTVDNLRPAHRSCNRRAGVHRA